MENFQNCTEQELLRLVRKGVSDAFGELSARYFGLLCGKASQFSGPFVPERDDLLQEGFFALYGAALSFDETKGASFATYAGVCVYNRMADCVRRHSGKKNGPLNHSLPLDSEAAASLAEKSSPEELVEAREQLQNLFHRLEGSLSQTERKALAVSLRACPRKEIKERYGMDLKTFDNALYRARKKLRQLQ